MVTTPAMVLSFPEKSTSCREHGGGGGGGCHRINTLLGMVPRAHAQAILAELGACHSSMPGKGMGSATWGEIPAPCCDLSFIYGLREGRAQLQQDTRDRGPGRDSQGQGHMSGSKTPSPSDNPPPPGEARKGASSANSPAPPARRGSPPSLGSRWQMSSWPAPAPGLQAEWGG